MPVFQLTNDLLFPPPELAREDGLLAVGGDLSSSRLLLAYSMGIFPWYSEGEPILWWSPDPRFVLFPEQFKVSKRLARTIRQNAFEITTDKAFEQVVRACADSRLAKNEGTWLDEEMINAYVKLHELGFAHSVESWQEGTLAGGLYGLAIGKIFFGESMFSRVTNSSKVALAYLIDLLSAKKYKVIDCQIPTDHLRRMGAKEIPGTDFFIMLHTYITENTFNGEWL